MVEFVAFLHFIFINSAQKFVGRFGLQQFSVLFPSNQMLEKALGSSCQEVVPPCPFLQIPSHLLLSVYMTNIGSLPTRPKILLACFAHAVSFLPLKDSWCNRHKKGKKSGKSNMQIVIYMENFFYSLTEKVTVHLLSPLPSPRQPTL